MASLPTRTCGAGFSDCGSALAYHRQQRKLYGLMCARPAPADLAVERYGNAAAWAAVRLGSPPAEGAMRIDQCLAWIVVR
jgi:hypothetical protein